MFAEFFDYRSPATDLLLEDMNRAATWDAIGPKLIERLRAQKPGDANYDTHPIAIGLRHDPNDPEHGDEHHQAKEDFLDKIEGLAPIGHAKTYGPLIGRIFAHSADNYVHIGEHDESIRAAVHDYHALKSSGLFERALAAGTVPAKFNNPSALRRFEDLQEIDSHPVVEAHKQQHQSAEEAAGQARVFWEGQDKHGIKVTGFVPSNHAALHKIYGIGKNNLKPEFQNGQVGWCTVKESHYKSYTQMGSKDAQSPIIVFKREGEDHPFLQVHAISGQVMGQLPDSAAAPPPKQQIARMRNTAVKAKDVDDYLPGLDLSAHMNQTNAEREARAQHGNARYQALAAIRNGTDEEVAAHAVHEDPEFRRTAVEVAGHRGLQQILAVAVDDPDRSVARTAMRLTSDPEVHRRFTRAGAHPLDKVAIASNHHLNADLANKLINVSRPGNTGAANGWDLTAGQIQQTRDDQWPSLGEDNVIAKTLISRAVPRRPEHNDPHANQYYGRRQNIFRRSNLYQDNLTHIGHTFLDNAAPHTAGAKIVDPQSPSFGRQPGQRSIEEMVHAGDTSSVSRHVANVVDAVATKSLNTALVDRVAKIPNVYSDHGFPNTWLETNRKIAQRGYLTKKYLDHDQPQLAAAAVIGTHPVVQGRERKLGPEQFDGSTVWRKNEKGKAAMFKPELIKLARKTDQEDALVNMVPYTKKWHDLKGILADRATEFHQRALGQHPNQSIPRTLEITGGSNPSSVGEHSGANLATALVSTHKDDEELHARFAGHLEPNVREAVAKNTKNAEILRGFTNDASHLVRTAALSSAHKVKHWDVVNAFMNGHTARTHTVDRNTFDRVARDADFRTWQRQQNEALNVKNYIKRTLLENVRI